MTTLISAIFYGISLGMLYFLMSSGFSIIYGLMRILNYSHGTLFVWGAYITYSVYSRTNSFWLGMAVSMVTIAAAGAIIEVFLLRNIKGDTVNQVLLTNGLICILYELIKVAYGARAYSPSKPEWLSGTFEVAGVVVPTFRILIIALGIVVFILIYLLLNKTKLGMMIQAGTERPRMLRASGINIRKIFTFTFCLGSALAGLAGAIGCFYFGLFPELNNQSMFLILIIVVIGGIGSFTGSLIGSLLVGIVQYGMSYFFPDFAMISCVMLMLLVLAFKPQGLLGGASNEK